MDFWSGPLRDSANPPARYALESDSEDELGDGVYDEGRHLTSKPLTKTHEVSIREVKPVPGGQLVVAVGIVGALLLQSAKKSEKPVFPLLVDGVEVGHLAVLSDNLHFVAISSTMPSVALHHLSTFLFDTFKPDKVSIIDTYPLPAYISSDIRPSPVIRFLRTSPALASDAIPPQVKPFSPPNLLGTQTLSSVLLCEAQVLQLTGELKNPAILVLLPASRIPPPPPKKLLPFGLSAKTELAIPWSSETVDTISTACGLQASDLVGSSFVKSEQGEFISSKGRNVPGVGDGNMYI